MTGSYIGEKHDKETDGEEESSDHGIVHFKYIFVNEWNALENAKEEDINECENGNGDGSAILSTKLSSERAITNGLFLVRFNEINGGLILGENELVLQLERMFHGFLIISFGGMSSRKQAQSE